MTPASAADYALDQVGRVRDDPAGRLASLREPVPGPGGRRRQPPALRAGRARVHELAGAPGAAAPRHRAPAGKPLVARGQRAPAARRLGGAGTGHRPPRVASSSSVLPWGAFVRTPSARTWYPAHNASIVAACVEHRAVAEAETRTERFFINVTLLRALYAHALVAAPRLALGWLAPLAPLLGDPRLGMTGVFLSVSRVVPDRYPLDDDLEAFVADEQGRNGGPGARAARACRGCGGRGAGLRVAARRRRAVVAAARASAAGRAAGAPAPSRPALSPPSRLGAYAILAPMSAPARILPERYDPPPVESKWQDGLGT